MTDKDESHQFEAARVEAEAAGHGGLSQEELDELVASSDTGGRAVAGPIGTFLMLVALAWSLFQLWIASPIPLEPPVTSTTLSCSCRSIATSDLAIALLPSCGLR